MNWLKEFGIKNKNINLYDKLTLPSFYRVEKKPKRIRHRDDKFLQEIGERIREMRIKKGLTQTQLAFLCNDKDYSQINRMELGKVNFSESHLLLIAEALQIKTKDLLPD